MPKKGRVMLRSITARFTPEQQRKLLALSKMTTEPGNMSAGLRYAVDKAQIPATNGDHPNQAGEATHNA